MQDNLDETPAEEGAVASPAGQITPEMTVSIDISNGQIGIEDMIIDGRVLRASDRIYDLVDVLDDDVIADTKEEPEIIVIDGRVYERVAGPKNNVFGLSDKTNASTAPLFNDGLHDEIMKAVTRIAEGIARESIPEIAERIIREEIEKLKGNTPLS
ncbi:MAG: hypothetical protein U1C55_09690 [Smithellaceae bacterium]|nr:hypothetical protein [Smithellaceae bacterium]